MDEINNFDKVSDIISLEEVEQFYNLLKKMNKANAVLEQIESSNLDPAPDIEGVVPYQVEISINCTVSHKGSSVAISPTVVDKLQKIYYIDMTTDNYSDMVESFLDKITDTLSDTCRTFIPPTEENK